MINSHRSPARMKFAPFIAERSMVKTIRKMSSVVLSRVVSIYSGPNGE